MSPNHLAEKKIKKYFRYPSVAIIGKMQLMALVIGEPEANKVGLPPLISRAEQCRVIFQSASHFQDWRGGGGLGRGKSIVLPGQIHTAPPP